MRMMKVHYQLHYLRRSDYCVWCGCDYCVVAAAVAAAAVVVAGVDSVYAFPASRRPVLPCWLVALLPHPAP